MISQLGSLQHDWSGNSQNIETLKKKKSGPSVELGGKFLVTKPKGSMAKGRGCQYEVLPSIYPT